MFVAFVLLLFSVNVQSISEGKRIVWTVENQNGSIQVPAKVPGGIYSDLHSARVIGDILAGYNDVLTRWIANDTWTYYGKIILTPEQLNHSVATLVLEGVDTVSFIEVNGCPVGFTSNMFIKYTFHVKPQLKVGENEIKVVFQSPITASKVRSNKYFTPPDCLPDVYNGECHANQLRKMQASFGWDWGPAFPSVGLWKPVYIQFYNAAVITAVTTHLEKVDTDWRVKIMAYFETDAQVVKHLEGTISAELFVDGNEKFSVSKEVETNIQNDGTFDVELSITVKENYVRLWWPNGYGKQPLYNLKVSFQSWMNNNEEKTEKTVRVGFRTVHLVEENADDILGNTTAGTGLTFYFKVNGYSIFMKGSNWIPAHILPELGYNKENVNNLLLAARDAHMAMLRVWGGGVYESEFFYRRCDELGILIWQDFLFACSMYPADSDYLDNVRKEIDYNVKRLQHHPSIAVWAGNNENEVALRGNWYGTEPNFDKYKQEYIQLYVSTMKPIVEVLDPGRRYLVSSPSNGIKSEEEGYIAQNPYDAHYGDTHYYNYLADNWNANTYPKTRFASEYGFQSMPSLLTLKTATMNMSDYEISSDFSIHRQHSPNGYEWIRRQINDYMKYDNFEKFVFYSQISQAMALKIETETYRQSQEDWYTMGALYWQLNDVWQAPSWSGIEFGGRWKMLHYYAKSFFSPVLVSPKMTLTKDIEVYLLNDRFVGIDEGEIIVEYFNYSSLVPYKTVVYSASVGPLSAKKQAVLTAPQEGYPDSIFLRFGLRDPAAKSPYNYIFPVPLKDIKGLREPDIKIRVTVSSFEQPHQRTIYNVDIRVDTVVLFLWLETPFPGEFDDNGFIVTQPQIRTIFKGRMDINSIDFERSIVAKFYIN